MTDKEAAETLYEVYREAAELISELAYSYHFGPNELERAKKIADKLGMSKDV